jgi:hypothetical protein
VYYAVIGDVIRSKESPDRRALQSDLEAVLAEVNKHYAHTVASRFVVTLGDEFQGLLNSAWPLLEIIDRIKFSIAPAKVRFGIGIGEIETEINPQASIGADGSAFWKAREAINHIHDQNDYGISTTRIASISAEPWIEVANDSLRLCDFIESRWRDGQYNLVRTLFLRNGDYNMMKFSQRDMAKYLGVSATTVNRQIKSSGYYQYFDMKRRIQFALQHEMEQS